MKKIISVMLSLYMFCALAACGEPKQETAVCTLTLDQQGIVYEITLEAEDDIVQTLTQVTSVDLSRYDEDQVKTLEASVESYAKVYEAYEKVSYKIERKDQMMYETIVIDATDAETLETLKEAELLPIEGEANHISLDATVKQLESVDWDVKVTEK